eukprot:scaffold132674_cov63-Phaeocystis_antarctica.AAC.3
MKKKVTQEKPHLTPHGSWSRGTERPVTRWYAATCTAPTKRRKSSAARRADRAGVGKGGGLAGWVYVQQLAASPVIALCRSHARSKGRTRSTAVGGALAYRRRPCAPADHEPPPEDTLPPVRGHWRRWGRSFGTGSQLRQLRQCPAPASNISSKRAYTILAAVRLVPEPDYHGMQLGAAPPASMAGAPS